MVNVDVDTLVVAGARVGIRAAGAGPVVLLVHGPLRSGAVFADLLSRLASGGARAVAVDLPGFGRSDKPPEGLSGSELAARLSAIGVVAGPPALVVAEGSGGDLAAAAFPAVPVWSLRAPIPRPRGLRAVPEPMLRAGIEVWARLGAPGLRGAARAEAALAARSRGTRAAAARWIRAEPLAARPAIAERRRLDGSRPEEVSRAVLSFLGEQR